ncbi:N-acetylmuramoyl-L-alanine amidase [Paenibacillus sp. PAMC21692]|uniref:N-acetylmuramoyl-L-alanine amidase family protein n=1 Tax=Paenibacillus sp. PAMC21692 TaxID=2762320 RepID=UPI00164EA0D8|nr:N-acetylmuramoyl-L-alanine amidase [Paenibacillus sp. PAMC21692]QNK57216.1 N-acetylmuramoyl-L-alanine amidase [Paenibacillus sp. PAMC21692]
MERTTRHSRTARFKTLSLMLLVAIAGIFLYMTQFAKDGGEMPRTLGGKENKTEQISSGGIDSDSESAKDTFKIVIDAGHGGKDPGSTGASGIFEKVSNLAIAKRVYDLLLEDSRFEVRMTRTDDTFVELEDRAGMANDWPADAFVSIHGNAYEDSSVSGSETFYRYDNGLLLAEAIHEELVDAMGFRDRGIRLNELKVLTLSKVPSLLIETGYLSNVAEETAILSEEGQNRMARAIVDGLKAYAEQT